MIRFSIRRPVTVSMLYLIVSLLGIAAWRDMPVELLPDTQLPRFTITASWPGASPEAVEAFVTSPIEATAQLVKGVENVQSISTEGRTEIVVDFRGGTDLEFARLELSERLSALENTLPGSASRPVITPYVPREFQEQMRPFLRYSLTGPYTAEALREHGEEVIRKGVLEVEGVREVNVTGGRRRLLEVEVDEYRTAALGVSATMVRNRIAALEDIREVGMVELTGTRHTLVLREHLTSLDELARRPVFSSQGRIVRFEEVATIHESWDEATSHYRINGQPAVQFTVQRQAGTNVIQMADAVRAKVASLEATLPTGVRVILDADESIAIREQFLEMRTRGIFSALVIFLVLIAFLRSFRSSVVVFATIAFSVLITLNLVYWTGLSLNMLTLMGLVMGFGMIDDNAIVVLENIYRLRREGLSSRQAAEQGTSEMVLPVIAGTLTTMIVVVPFVYLQGELRSYYVPLGIVVGACMLASLFVSFTFIPALSGVLLRKVPPDGVTTDAASPVVHQPGGKRLQEIAGGSTNSGEPFYVRFYALLMRGTLRFPWSTALLTTAVLLWSGWLFDQNVNRDVVWQSWAQDRTYIQINITLPPGEEIARVDEMARFFENHLQQMPEVSGFVTNIRPQTATIRVEFPDSLQFGTAPLTAHEVLQGYAANLGGANIGVYGFGKTFAISGLADNRSNYTIQVLGYNYEEVRRIAEGLGDQLKQFTRVSEVNTNRSVGSFGEMLGDRVTEVIIHPNRTRLGMLGLTSGEFTSQVNAAVLSSIGARGGNALRLNGEELPFAVKYSGHDRMDVNALREVGIRGLGGERARVDELATITEREVLARITRADQQYERTIAYNFLGSQLLGDLIRDAVLENTGVPPGYSVIGKREFSFSSEERRQIYGVMAVALLFVFMLTAGLYNSLRQPFVILLTVPMAMIGVFLIFWQNNASFTREAYIGVIMMSGIVVNNAILLVDHINRLRRERAAERSETPFELKDAILRGTLDRVRPILMTTATTIAGLLPLVLFSESPDKNIWNAMGYVMIGGLTSSTLLVLTVTPALYLLVERRSLRSLR
jgi:HAE1 family hydrophobic/amphiphilic exporter-1